MTRFSPFFLCLFAGALLLTSCNNNMSSTETQPEKVRLITLDPGHFHAALVQKYMYDDVDSVVHIYAPGGSELDGHMARINSYNSRAGDPTRWQSEIYTGPDYLDKMIAEKAGNVVVIAGNNAQKTQYILSSVQAGLNVLADKPMVINRPNFEVLKTAFTAAAGNHVLLYDIMTERYEVTTILQKELSHTPALFGEMEKGSVDNPAITKESVHHFFKYVSGSPLIRPAWFFDVEQEGEGIVDVSTHLVDLVFWECFPGQIIDYQTDLNLDQARRWTTDLHPAQFNLVTGLTGYPDYLSKYVIQDSLLSVSSNGEINFTVKGIHAKVSVIWNFQAPEGAGDTHFSIVRGTKANMVIRQGAEQGYKPVLYVEPVDPSMAATLEPELKKALDGLSDRYPGLSYKASADGWEVLIPEQFKEGHEAHFARVMEKYLQYLKEGKLPDWEVPNMIAKYWVTTGALEMALGGKE